MKKTAKAVQYRDRDRDSERGREGGREVKGNRERFLCFVL